MFSDTSPDPDQEMLPDERAIIAERLTALTDESNRVSADTVAHGFDHLFDESSDETE